MVGNMISWLMLIFCLFLCTGFCFARKKMDVFKYLKYLCAKHGVPNGQYKFGEICNGSGSFLAIWCILEQPCLRNNIPGTSSGDDPYKVWEFIGFDKFSISTAQEKAVADAVFFMSKLYCEDPIAYSDEFMVETA